MFRMYYTDEDYKILQFVEEYGVITIKECQNLFYNRQAKGYEMARRHLSKLVEYNKLSIDKNICDNKNVYYADKKPKSYHAILTLDYYSELIKHGAEIIYFKTEQEWINKKYRSDAYCCYHIGNKVFFDIVESIKTKTVETQKYIDIYNSKEAHKLSDNIYEQIGGKKRNLFPRIIIIDDVKRKNALYINDDIKIIQLDYSLHDFSKIFV